MLSRSAKHFFVRLKLRKEDTNDTLFLLRRSFERVVDCGRGTEEAPSDWWVEIRHPHKEAGDVLRHLVEAGLEREQIRQCCEIEPMTGTTLARQRPLFKM